MWNDDNNDEINVLLTRLPFGSSPAPAHFSIGSYITCDLANDLTECTLWDPDTLKSPLQDSIPETKLLSPDIPFGEAMEAEVALPPDLIQEPKDTSTI
jgi:hypothetical protein